jgi:hypothetical protein
VAEGTERGEITVSTVETRYRSDDTLGVGLTAAVDASLAMIHGRGHLEREVVDAILGGLEDAAGAAVDVASVIAEARERWDDDEIVAAAEVRDVLLDVRLLALTVAR